MRRILTFLFFCLVVSAPSMLAQTETTPHKNFSHWSIYAKGGVTLFDGDVQQDYNQLIPKGGYDIALGGGVEYSFNPRWGLGIQYNYLPYSADKDKQEFSGTMHFPSVYLSTNLSNLFYQNRKHVRWSVYLNAGYGIGFYDVESKKPPTLAKHVDDGRAGALLAELNFEYNISRSFAIGWYNQYLMFNKDNLEGLDHIKGNENDALFSTMLGLRYKFGAVKKDHVRMVDMETYTGEKSTDRLDALEKKVAQLEENAVPKSDIEKINQRLDNIEEQLKDSDGDGVPDVRDLEPDTPKGSYVNYWGQAIPKEMNEIVPSLFFDFDSYQLQSGAQQTVREIALQMAQNPNLKLEIRGYADNSGTDSYNEQLSTKRAQRVKDELVKVYKIEESRIIANGLGKIPEPASKYPLNRRCDFFFDK